MASVYVVGFITSGNGMVQFSNAQNQLKLTIQKPDLSGIWMPTVYHLDSFTRLFQNTVGLE
jgi:hypothetical protein